MSPRKSTSKPTAEKADTEQEPSKSEPAETEPRTTVEAEDVSTVVTTTDGQPTVGEPVVGAAQDDAVAAGPTPQQGNLAGPAENRAAAMARLAAGEAPKAETVDLAPVILPLAPSNGREVDWTDKDTKKKATAVVTSTMVNHGYLDARRGDRLTAGVEQIDRLVALGAAQPVEEQ